MKIGNRTMQDNLGVNSFKRGQIPVAYLKPLAVLKIAVLAVVIPSHTGARTLPRRRHFDEFQQQPYHRLFCKLVSAGHTDSIRTATVGHTPGYGDAEIGRRTSL